MALSQNLLEALYRLRNLSNNRQREGDAAASINQINAVLRLISSEIDALVISGGGVTEHSLLTGKDAADQHPMDAITGLISALSGKASSSHSHPISNVTGLQTALDGKQASSTALTLIAALTGAGVLQRNSNNTWELITDVRRIHIGTSAPADTTMLWVDTN